MTDWPTPPKKHRWREGVRAGRWLPTRKEAIEAAIRAGVATREDGNVYWNTLASIEEKDA